MVVAVHETADQTVGGRAAWIYSPGLGRVARAPDVGYDNPGTAADGTITTIAGTGTLTTQGVPIGPDREFPLGADSLGRCELSRLLYGGRVSLSTAISLIVRERLTGESASGAQR